ncbi:MAG TPA: hypothetical protein VEK74_06960 [Burkholderiaceae bacterium]|nr:hypothetical protein [Burkholderiaceae bacterium]
MDIAAKVWKRQTEFVEPSIGAARNEFLIGTAADVYGYGYANITVAIGVKHFCDVAAAMMTASPEAATKAFGAALQGGTAERPLRPLEIRSEDLITAADEACCFVKEQMVQLAASIPQSGSECDHEPSRFIKEQLVQLVAGIPQSDSECDHEPSY